MTTPETPHAPVIPLPRVFFAIAVVAGLFFVIWSWQVFADPSSIRVFDLECAQYWSDFSRTHHGPLSMMIFLTELGGIAGMTLVAIMGAIWQTAINHRFLAIAWLGIVLGGGMVNSAIKAAYDRPRPTPFREQWVVHETNHSYPSGHSMGSAIGYGMLAYALVLPQRRRPRRFAAVILCTCIFLAVGFSRIYLRAHWFSDVIAGWSIGVCWVCFCIGCLEWRRRRLQATTS